MTMLSDETLRRSSVLSIIDILQRRVETQEFHDESDPSAIFGWRCGFEDALDNLRDILAPVQRKESND